MDPDYINQPDVLKIQELEHEGQQELCKRVRRVIEKKFTEAQDEKHAEIETIDERILQVQQMLHTYRYIKSLNYYSSGKLKQKTNDNKRKRATLHPTVSKNIENSMVPTELLNADIENKDYVNKRKILPPEENLSANHCSDNSLPRKKLKTLNATEEKKSSLHHISNPVPNPPTTESVSSRGRLEKFQKKKRLVIGNTYQYIAANDACSAGEESLKFKWKVYVRGPPDGEDIASFVSSITFMLDESYAPHDVIVIDAPPFSLCRRGWGEFKVNILIEFKSKRNQQLRLLHPLTLARKDDNLAFTGLWRLGIEKWYDIYVFDEIENNFSNEINQDKTIEPGGCKEKDLSKELETGKLLANVEGNITIAHNNNITPKEEVDRQDNESTFNKCSLENTTDKLENPIAEETTIANKKNENIKSIRNILKAIPEASKNNIASNVNSDKSKMIRVKQEDGSLVNFLIPAHLYPLAAKIAANTNKTNPEISKPISQSTTLQTPLKSMPLQNASTNNKVITINVKNPSQPVIKPITSSPKPHYQKIAPKQLVMLDKNKFIIQRTNNNVAVPQSGHISVLKPTLVNSENSNGRFTIGSSNTTIARKPITIKNISQNSGLVISSKHLQQSPSRPITLSGPKMEKIVQVPITGKNGQIVMKGINLENLKAHIAEPQKLIQNNNQPVAKKMTLPVVQNLTNVIKPLFTQNIVPISSPKVTPLKLSNNGVTSHIRVVSPSMKQVSTVPVKVISNTNSIKSSIQTFQGGQVENKTKFVISGNKVIGHIINNPNGQGIQNGKNINYLKCNSMTNTVSPISKSNVINSTSNNNSKGKKLIKLPLDILNRIIQSKSKMDEKLKSSLVNCMNGSGNSKTIALDQLLKILSTDNNQNNIKKMTKVKVEDINDPASDSDDDSIHEDNKLTLSEYKNISKNISSKHGFLGMWMRALPVFTTDATKNQELLDCTISRSTYLKWPLGKQRAVEYKRARDIRKLMRECYGAQDNPREWSVHYIVAWGRRHGYTPVPHNLPLLHSDKLPNVPDDFDLANSLTPFKHDDIDVKPEIAVNNMLNPSSPDIIIDVENINISPIKKKPLTPKKELDTKVVHVPLNSEDSIFSNPLRDKGCEWLEQKHTELMIMLGSEEIAPGVMMETSKAVMWQVTMRLMEDLLRSSHAAAWGNSSSPATKSGSNIESHLNVTGPPSSITIQDVKKALASGRPEFNFLTNSGLGKTPQNDSSNNNL